MATWTEVEEAFKTEASAKLPEWDTCKVIRGWKESDADFFSNTFNTDGVIIEDCPKVCDCKIGVYRPKAGEKEREDWVIVVG